MASDTWTVASGRQFELTHGRQRAVVVEVGATLREYVVGGVPVLDGFDPHQMADGARGQPLLPWPNRVEDGQYSFAGHSYQLAIDEVSRHNAIHGLTRWQNWNMVAHTADRVRLRYVLHPRPGYPFTLRLEIEYSLSEAGLQVHTTARNDGPSPLPFGTGQHPYITVGTPSVDSAVLELHAARRLELDAHRLLPTGATQPTANSDYDFGEPRPIGPLVLDDCFTDLEHDQDGIARVHMANPATGHAVELWMSARYTYLQVFSGETLAPDRRRHGLAVEPMTCPPNAFRTGTDLIVLQPNGSITLAWGLYSRQ